MIDMATKHTHGDLSIDELSPGDLIDTDLIIASHTELSDSKPPSLSLDPPLISVSEYPDTDYDGETDELLLRHGEPGAVLVTIDDEWATVVDTGSLRVVEIVETEDSRAEETDYREIVEWIIDGTFNESLGRVNIDGHQLTAESTDQSLKIVAEITLA